METEIAAAIAKALETVGLKPHLAALAITVMALNWLGWRVKKLPSIRDEWIPALLVLVGMVIYVLLSVSFRAYTPEAWGVGAGSAILAVGLHQLKRQTGALLKPHTPPPPTEPISEGEPK